MNEDKKYKIRTYYEEEGNSVEDRINKESELGWEVVSLSVSGEKIIILYFNKKYITL